MLWEKFMHILIVWKMTKAWSQSSHDEAYTLLLPVNYNLFLYKPMPPLPGERSPSCDELDGKLK